MGKYQVKTMDRLKKILILLFVTSFGLAACGGDSVFTTDGVGGGASGPVSISLALVDQATGNATTSVSAISPGELRATVYLNGGTAASQVVTFTSTIGTLTPASALTNNTGLASVILTDGGSSGAGTVTAEVTINGKTATAELNFQVSSSVANATVDMGNGTGGAFVADVVNLGGVTSLAAGGTVTATVNLVEASNNNSAYTTPVTVSFSSGCVLAGTATMDATVVTTAGVASSTYLAQGCTGADTIVATANVGTTLNASANFTVQPASVGSIEFISANPGVISLQGTGGSGGTETAVVVFSVVDAQGNPVANQTVNFVLNTVVGGMSLSPSSATSDQAGLVQTVVQSGTVATSVGVTATTTSAGNTYQTQSSQLVVTTGIPDQNSFSLSATILAPEAWGYDGVSSTITARLADRFNNPVPDGTAVTFTTEGGSIEGSCTTTAGACSVDWVSQSPRPCGQVLGASTVALAPTSGPNVCNTATGTNASNPVTGFAPLGQPYGGRATIVATVVGEESFIDTNGNGVFDDGDTMTDLPEAWRDENEDGARGAYEPFFDFNANGSYDAADGAFNGVLCSRTVAPLCSNNKTLHIRDSLTLVMAGSTANIAVTPSSFNLSCGVTQGFTVVYADLHHQPLPAGTTVTVTSSLGSIAFGGSYIQPDTNSNRAIAFSGTLEGAGTAGTASSDSGTLVVIITTPKGVVSTASYSVSETCI
jgi:hypothetical protein